MFDVVQQGLGQTEYREEAEDEDVGEGLEGEEEEDMGYMLVQQPRQGDLLKTMETKTTEMMIRDCFPNIYTSSPVAILLFVCY